MTLLRALALGADLTGDEILGFRGTDVIVIGGVRYKAAQQDITTAGFVDISSLTFPVVASKAYAIEAFLVYRSSSLTMGVRFGVNGPASPGRIRITVRKQSATGETTDSYTEGDIAAYDTASPSSVNEPASAADLTCHMVGVFTNGANAGTFALRLDKESVAGTGSVMPGSWLSFFLLN